MTDDTRHDTRAEILDEEVTLAVGALPDARVTMVELISSFYLWLCLWLIAWAAIPAIIFGWSPILITSGSMGPVISAGDIVLIDEPPAGEVLAPGTVITFHSASDPDLLITHRIDGVREDGLYRTRGDANGQPDSTPVAPEDIVGVGRMMIPVVALPLLWFQTDTLMFGLFVIGTLAAFVAAAATHGQAEEIARGDRRHGADQPAHAEAVDA